MIRHTRSGGTLQLSEPERAALVTCGGCGSVRTGRDDPYAAAIALNVEVGPAAGAADGARLETAVCADCLSEALAILFGRRHVQGGGAVEDLSDASRPPADATARPPDPPGP